MFELTSTPAKIAHINIREEKHGEEDVLALDMKVEAKMSNDFLSQLHPTLKWSLYDKPSEADLLKDADHAPVLRYPLMVVPLKWVGEILGGTATIHAPVSKKDLVFTSDINELRLSPMEGGTVLVGFRVQFRPEPAEVAKVAALLGQQVEITIAKPVAEVEDEGEQLDQR